MSVIRSVNLTRHLQAYDHLQSEKILYKNHERVLLAANVIALMQIVPFILQLLLVLFNLTKYNQVEPESDVAHLT